MIRTEYDQLFIGGSWEVSAGSERIPVCSPHTGEQFGAVPLAIAADVDRAVAAARRAFDGSDWPGLDHQQRIEPVRRLLDIYRTRVTEMTEIRVGSAPG